MASKMAAAINQKFNNCIFPAAISRKTPLIKKITTDGFVDLKNIEKEVLQLKFEQKLTEICNY